MKFVRLIVVALAFAALAACGNPGGAATEGGGNATPASAQEFTVLSGSENQSLEPLVQQWAAANGVQVKMTYQGSVDIMRCLERGKDCPYNAIWLAQSLWIELGDKQHVLKGAKSIMRSPVILGVRKSVAQRLGWTGATQVTMKDIMTEAEKGSFPLSMTSATQSNSGTTGYLGIWYAMSGNPDMLTAAHLNDAAVGENVRKFLATVNRGSGSSGWLKEALVENPDKFGAMINYEAMIIEANRGWEKNGVHVPGLVERGAEPLCAVYPSDGMTVADSPLAYLDRGDAAQAKAFASLQSFLLSKESQDRIKGLGRRTGLLGLDVQGGDASVWNPDWCVDTKRDIAPVPMPGGSVIRQALSMYQTNLRKPSLTVWVLDTSGSMAGERIQTLRDAMQNILDARLSEQNMLQIGPKDVNIIITFSNEVKEVWSLEGNDPTRVTQLLMKTQSLESGGGTDLYAGLIRAVQELQAYDKRKTLWNYLPSIVAMTDGESERVNVEAFRAALQSTSFGRDIPIHSVAFGESDVSQLQDLAKASSGRLFDASKDGLVKTLRDVKGYN